MKAIVILLALCIGCAASAGTITVCKNRGAYKHVQKSQAVRQYIDSKGIDPAKLGKKFVQVMVDEVKPFDDMAVLPAMPANSEVIAEAQQIFAGEIACFTYTCSQSATKVCTILGGEVETFSKNKKSVRCAANDKSLFIRED